MEIASSDARIQEILDLQLKLANWSPWSTGTPAMAEMLILLYEEEHLHAAKLLDTPLQHWRTTG
jgi:hypothetical protein